MHGSADNSGPNPGASSAHLVPRIRLGPDLPNKRFQHGREIGPTDTPARCSRWRRWPCRLVRAEARFANGHLVDRPDESGGKHKQRIVANSQWLGRRFARGDAVWIRVPHRHQHRPSRRHGAVWQALTELRYSERWLSDQPVNIHHHLSKSAAIITSATSWQNVHQ